MIPCRTILQPAKHHKFRELEAKLVAENNLREQNRKITEKMQQGDLQCQAQDWN
jgi:hypothetical protein